MPDIGLQSIKSEDHMSLLLQASLDAFMISDTQGDQFFIALYQMRHAALGNAHAACQESLMYFGHTAMIAKTPLTDQGNHLQAKFSMGQCPASLFFWSIALMKARTIRL